MSDLYQWVQGHDTENGDLWTALQKQNYTQADSFAVLSNDNRAQLEPALRRAVNVTNIMVARLYAAAQQAQQAQGMFFVLCYLAYFAYFSVIWCYLLFEFYG